MELSGCNIKKFLIVSQKKAFFIFRETEIPKKILIFQETELSYISGNRNPKRLLIFQEVSFRARKKSFLYFNKWNFLAPSFKNFFYFRRNFKVPS